MGKNFEKNCANYISKGILKDLVSLAIYDEDEGSSPWKNMAERRFGFYVDNDTIPPDHIKSICTCYFKFSKELSIDEVKKLWRTMLKHSDFLCMISFCVETKKFLSFLCVGCKHFQLKLQQRIFIP